MIRFNVCLLPICMLYIKWIECGTEFISTKKSTRMELDPLFFEQNKKGICNQTNKVHSHSTNAILISSERLNYKKNIFFCNYLNFFGKRRANTLSDIWINEFMAQFHEKSINFFVPQAQKFTDEYNVKLHYRPLLICWKEVVRFDLVFQVKKRKRKFIETHSVQSHIAFSIENIHRAHRDSEGEQRASRTGEMLECYFFSLTTNLIFLRHN